MSLVNSLIDYLRGSRPRSANLAKERLQIILAHENPTRRGGPAYLPDLRRELIGVIAKYVAIDPEQVKMHLDHQGNYDLLELNVMLPESPARQ